MPAVVHSAQTGTTAAGTLTITTATAGNKLVVFAGQTASVSTITGSDNIGGSTGWTTDTTTSTTFSNGAMFVMYKTAVGGETTITPSFPGTAQGLCCFEVSGIDNTPAIDVLSTTFDSGSAVATKTTNAVTTTNAGDIILAAMGQNGNSGTISAWTGTGPMTNIGTAGTRVIGGSYIPNSTLTSATFTANWLNANRVGSLVFALKPPSVSITVSDSTATSESISLLATNNIALLDSTQIMDGYIAQYDGFGASYFGAPYFGGNSVVPALQLLEINSVNVSDTTTTGEAIQVLANLNIAALDMVTTSENTVVNIIGTTVNDNIVVSDSTLTSENANLGAVLEKISAKDSQATTENIVVQLSDNAIFISDSTSTSENTAVIFGSTADLITVQDSSSVAESISVVISFLPILILDTTMTTESVSLLGTLLINKNDSTTTNESLNFTSLISIRVIDTFSTSESIQVTGSLQPQYSLSVLDLIATTENAITNLSTLFLDTESLLLTIPASIALTVKIPDTIQINLVIE